MKIEIRKYDPVPEGIYHLYTKDVNTRSSSNGEFFSWQCEVMSDDEEHGGKSISFAMSPTFSPSSKGYQFLKALGMQDNTDKGFDLDTDEFLGISFWAKLIIKKNDKGEPTNKFESFWSEEEWEKTINKSRKVTSPVSNQNRVAGPGVKVSAPTNRVVTPDATNRVVTPSTVNKVTTPVVEVENPEALDDDGFPQ